jgi:hypothetical protein
LLAVVEQELQHLTEVVEVELEDLENLLEQIIVHHH